MEETALEKFCQERKLDIGIVKKWDEGSLIEELEECGYKGAKKGNVVAAWRDLQGTLIQFYFYHSGSTSHTLITYSL